MAYLLRTILSLYAYIYFGLGYGQNHYDFKKLTNAMIGNTLISHHTNVTSMIQCALVCSSALSCDHAQYCAQGGLCALYRMCATCPASSINCIGGAQTVTALLTGPPSRVAEPPICGGHKRLVSGSDGVGDDQLSESSYYTDGYCPGGRSGKFVRLNSTFPCTSWSPNVPGPKEYVQVDFRAVKLTTGVVLAGRINHPIQEPGHNLQYVTSFMVHYSIDCVTFTPALDSYGNKQTFAGCSYVDEVVTRCFHALLPARCIRINPTTSVTWNSMRFDILGY